VSGVYLDDCLSGVRVEGNIFDGVAGNSLVHGGGRDDLMVNNVFADYHVALATDARCLTWLPQGMPNRTPGDSWNLLEKLEANRYQQPPWSVSYPACAAIPDDWNAITAPDAGWLLPQGCTFSDNVGDGSGRWLTSASGAVAAYAEIANDLPDAGPLFVNPDAGDLRLLPGSPAFSLPGFVDIPFRQIGIQP
jgi:hypothetical protein